MKRFAQRRSIWAFLGFAVADTICVGAGMGVPIFCILLGFPVGYAIARSLAARDLTFRSLLAKILRCAALTSAFTFLLMAAIWGPVAIRLADPAFDVANFGIPLILYDPLASFVGWVGLMIFVSPFLQMLTTLFGAHLTLLWWFRRNPDRRVSWREVPREHGPEVAAASPTRRRSHAPGGSARDESDLTNRRPLWQ